MANQWTENDIPDQTGRVAVVTGANSGIGWDTARALARKGATVILGCRSVEKSRDAAARIEALGPAGKVVPMLLDLADLDSVRAFAGAFRADYARLDLLANNAGVMAPPYGKTAQGFEQQFGVNHLGHFALTGLLLDRLIAAPGARVVTVSSWGHNFGMIDFDNLSWERGYDPQRAYSLSKLANLLFTYELQRRLDAARLPVIAAAAHPGWTTTNLQKHWPAIAGLNPLLGQPPAMGALPTLYAATAPDVRGGDYFGPGGIFELHGSPRKVRSSARSHDRVVASRLWVVSEDLTQVSYLSGTVLA